MDEEKEIFLKCIKERSKLRIKIISNGYFNNANCQFPKNLREEGMIYSVSIRNISLAQSKNGKYFYRITKPIKIHNLNKEIVKEIPIKVFDFKEEPNCIICLDSEKERICVPCGHYCMCEYCINYLTNPKKCPLCRTIIKTTILPSEL
jgi:hypothetical protein